VCTRVSVSVYEAKQNFNCSTSVAQQLIIEPDVRLVLKLPFHWCNGAYAWQRVATHLSIADCRWQFAFGRCSLPFAVEAYSFRFTLPFSRLFTVFQIPPAVWFQLQNGPQIKWTKLQSHTSDGQSDWELGK